MNKARLSAIVLFCVSLIYPITSLAVLVEDPTEWAKTYTLYKKVVQQYLQLQKQYHVLNEQYQKLQAIQHDEVGHYGYGNLLNSNADLKQREWSPANWQDALHGLSGGNPARYHQLLNTYKQNHQTLSTKAYAKGASHDKTLTYKGQVQTNRAASVTASYAFNEVKHHLETVHQLSQHIESAPNVKAATDLNSRLLVEIAYIQAQNLKMQSIVNEQLAQQSASRIAGETRAAKFNRLPDE